jgi:hypothetical protein
MQSEIAPKEIERIVARIEFAGSSERLRTPRLCGNAS